MLWGLLSSRWIQVGIVFFVLCVGGSLLYSWHVKRTIAAEMVQAKQAMQARENRYKTRMAKKTNVPTETNSPGFVGVPKESDETQNKLEITATQTSPNADKGDVADTIFSHEIPAESPADVRVSPHGFGAYPPIPEGAPIAEFDENDSVEMELMLRVAIKKWNEGHRFVGASIANGKVYLNYPNTLYVKWGDPQETPDGNVFQPIVRTRGPGDIALTPEQMHSGKIPEGVTGLDLDSEGLDPYEVLELPQ